VALAASDFAPRAARQVHRTGSFELPCGADTAFSFFSPEGEREWVKGWNPTPVFPDRIEFSRDTVFREGPPGDEAVWTIVDANWEMHRAEYVRVAHRSHTGRVVVKIEPGSGDRCKVVVEYTITAFGATMATLIETFSEEAYAAKMRAWKEQITGCLGNR